MNLGNNYNPKDQFHFWHDARLDLSLLQAYYVDHKYPLHSHDYYVICLIESGESTYEVSGQRYLSPPQGIICINPSEVHAGGAAEAFGLGVRCFYPTVHHFYQVLEGLGRPVGRPPLFRSVYVSDPLLWHKLLTLHELLQQNGSRLAQESAFFNAFALLIEQNTDAGSLIPIPQRNERAAVVKGKRYLEERYSANVSLAELANHVGLSPYYYLRMFRREVGLPPYTYLQNIRIRRAQALIKAGNPLADVSHAVGFSNQSHLTHLFKRYLGVTPGRYATEIRRS